jgi:hypothetical protein
LAGVFVRQGTSLSFVLEAEPGCGQEADQLLAAVEAPSDGADPVAQELVRVDVAVAEVRRHDEQTILAENAA